jgi:alpha-L-rhamnosidase
LAGITPLKPGYEQIRIRPSMPSSLTFVAATMDTVKGRVRLRWQRNSGTVEMQVSVPVNTTALVYVPATSRQSVTESGQPLETAIGAAFVGMEGAQAVLRLGSGDYRFTSTMNSP